MPPVIDNNKCIQCGTCGEVCAEDVYFGSEEGKLPVATIPNSVSIATAALRNARSRPLPCGSPCPKCCCTREKKTARRARAFSHRDHRVHRGRTSSFFDFPVRGRKIKTVITSWHGNTHNIFTYHLLSIFPSSIPLSPHINSISFAPLNLSFAFSYSSLLSSIQLHF